MNIIFFDGVCGLCNGFVDFIMKIDKAGQFKFSPLQSEYAKKNLPAEFTENLNSVVVQIDGKNYRKSDGVFQVWKKLGAPWSALSLLKALPAPLTDAGYDLVAKTRYKIFGKKDSCRLPTPDERARFLL